MIREDEARRKKWKKEKKGKKIEGNRDDERTKGPNDEHVKIL